MRKMKRIGTILGILLTVTILISGSAVATWVHADHHEPAYTDCENPTYAEGADNDEYASLGHDDPSPVLGYILLDLGSGNEMPPWQDFTVFADTDVNETYHVSVAPDDNPNATQYVGTGWDTEDLIFQTPGGPPGTLWRYIFLEGITGQPASGGGDYYYGPEIDAVGWDKL